MKNHFLKTLNKRYSFPDTSNGGAIAGCKDCSGTTCCGIVKENGIIEPPYLTEYDLQNIIYFTGLDLHQFAVQKINPVTDHIIHMMRTENNSGCIFFDRINGKCQIHSFRPMDCRLFPLDIEFANGKYYWALYRYGGCRLREGDLGSLLSYSTVALQILGDELHDYATIPVPGMNTVGYEIQAEVVFNANG